MSDKRRDNRTKALEAALHAAMEKGLSEISFDPVLDFLKDNFTCERIYIFVKNAAGTYDMTHEWLSPGIPSKKSIFQHLSVEAVQTYYTRYRENSDNMFIIRNIDDQEEADPEIYEILKPQGVHSLISVQLSLHGKDLGFFGIDNPAREDIEYLLYLVRSIRNLLSVGILYYYTREDQKQMSATRHLTNIGDWHEFYEYAEKLEPAQSIAVVFSNLIDLRRINAMKGRQVGDSILIETGHIFTEVFDADCVFRLSGDKHVVAIGNVSYKWLEKRLAKLLSIFRERNINIEIGSVWEPSWDGNPDDILHRASLKMRDIVDVGEDNVPLEVSAEAPLYRNDQFIQSAGEWLRETGHNRVVVVYVKISHYPLFASVYGSMPSGTYTRNIGSVLRKAAGIYQGVAGSLGDGTFCLMVPLEGMTENELLDQIRDGIRLMNVARGFSPIYGVYISEHKGESASQMFDYARSAAGRAPENSDRKAYVMTDRQVTQLIDTSALLNNPWTLLKSGEFFFVLQQIFDLNTREVMGREAFARWSNGGELYMPEVFLPGMLRNESVYALDRLMLEKICTYLRKKNENTGDQCPRSVPVSINIEAIDLTIGDQARHLGDLIVQNKLASSAIAIEIPADLCIRHYRDACRLADQLAEDGIPLIIDDCGEYPIDASLLKRLGTKEIKLTGEISRHICSGREEQEIVRRHVETARKLGIPVVAKHIESEDQAIMYMTLGCARGQGYLFDHPAAPGDL